MGLSDVNGKNRYEKEMRKIVLKNRWEYQREDENSSDKCLQKYSKIM